MSDSILYLAIVVIWVVILVPAWVRRPQASKSDAETTESADFEVQAEFDEVIAEVASQDGHVDVSDPDSEYRDDVHMHSYGPADPRELDEPVDERPAAGPSQSREQMMRARRRMFTILAGLTLVTAMFVLMGLVQWWICVPPIAMLVLYVLLLREIAMADAELARKRQAWETRTARDTWRRSYRVAQAAASAALAGSEVAEPTAEIIDISLRVGEQLYDQYADAAVRAVGD